MENWKVYLDNSTLNVLPADFVRSAENKVIESSITAKMPEQVVTELKAFAEKIGKSSYTVAVALTLLLVNRLSGDEDVTVGSVLPSSEHAVARYSQFSKTTTLSELIAAVEAGEKLAKESPQLHSSVRSEFNGEDQFRVLYLQGSLDLFKQVSYKDLAIVFDIDHSEVSAVYNSLLFTKVRVEYILEQFIALIQGVSNGKDTLLCEISLITESQHKNGVIPNPKKDLEFNGYRGSIQDIFAANAAKFPERECVVETANPYIEDSKTRSFTYQQISEASNIVAHYLVNSSIVIDDVVMIYAYRGVDLVVAVMGVLKAGATFSVIDPAYPAARQNIYFSVAKPRGLIVLKKAGKLSPIVKDYISDNLNLKAELIDLELNDDGSISAAQNISEASEKRAKETGVKVGPDNHPTLSFTSGSEGIPKGVRGRHFSLAYYFPWMSQTFGLSEHDKFTMLSGIAHDPIQRDIFTPLFFGARLFVPTADDIGTPGRLAEWMAENGCTVTHLTPAMGQLLSAQATAQIPALKNAFFVGDILTKRDCIRLQALAHNVAIINMYGTTETQRAVSYYRVPSANEDPQFLMSQKDTIAAGKGMHNVQMLVVNRNSPQQICGVGEIGEIYVRAAGMSDGYLQLPDMTAQKFLTSWFVSEGHWKSTEPIDDGWMGPRDRLYRTGDLGRYLPDGNTEVSGRADDQVKIRGFRIELGEINTHLSRHPLVRENVTLVRRDKDEEPVLVAYIVPDAKDNNDMMSAHESLDADEDAKNPVVKGLVMYQRLIKDIRSYLKTKLPSYAIPSLIVPLECMPLNPNGKIDKPRLPFPDTVQMQLAAKHLSKQGGAADADDSQWTSTEAMVRDLWLSILPTKPPVVEVDDSFFDMGGHSILATKMIFEARAKLGVPDLPLGAVFSSPTIKGFAQVVNDLRKGDKVLTTAPATDTTDSTATVSFTYAEDADKLVKELPKYLTPTKPLPEYYSVFLTGATGFLGAYILANLLNRNGTKMVFAQVRAKDAIHGLERIMQTGKAYGIWKDEYADRIRVVTGSLESEKLGLDDTQWKELIDEVDVIIHNGALVHWVYPYSTLRGPNVIGIINVMSLCAEGKPKYMTFVSSTSVLDNQYFLDLGDKLIENGKDGIPESDDLSGSRTGLGTGYGQSKWVGEFLLREAGKYNGLKGNIVRPGYVVGDSVTGVSNTDDFLLRMLKGCQEIGYYPSITNSVNMVPVDHVARVVAASGLNASELSEFSVVQVTSHPRITFDQFLGSLNDFGYKVAERDYVTWRGDLEKDVVEKGNNALFPLLHFVLENLPQDTKAPELDDKNARTLLKTDAKFTGKDFSAGAGVDHATLAKYVSFLVAVGFLEKPSVDAKLPPCAANETIIKNFEKAGGRAR